MDLNLPFFQAYKGNRNDATGAALYALKKAADCGYDQADGEAGMSVADIKKFLGDTMNKKTVELCGDKLIIPSEVQHAILGIMDDLEHHQLAYVHRFDQAEMAEGIDPKNAGLVLSKADLNDLNEQHYNSGFWEGLIGNHSYKDGLKVAKDNAAIMGTSDVVNQMMNYEQTYTNALQQQQQKALMSAAPLALAQTAATTQPNASGSLAVPFDPDATSANGSTPTPYGTSSLNPVYADVNPTALLSADAASSPSSSGGASGSGSSSGQAGQSPNVTISDSTVGINIGDGTNVVINTPQGPLTIDTKTGTITQGNASGSGGTSGGAQQPPASGGAQQPPASGGAQQPPASGGAQPPASGGAQPPASGGTQPPASGGAQPPASGGAQQPPASGGTQPPTSGGAQPPTSGGTQPPTSGGTQPPTSGGTQPPTSGGAQPPASGGAQQPPASGGAQPSGSGQSITIPITKSTVTINLGKSSQTAGAGSAEKPEATKPTPDTGKTTPTDKPGVTSKAYQFKGNGPNIELIENADSKITEEKPFEDLESGSGGQVTFNSGDTVYGYKLDDLSVVGVKVHGKDDTEVQFFLDKPLKLNDTTTIEAGKVDPKDYYNLTQAFDGNVLDIKGLHKLPTAFKDAIGDLMQHAKEAHNKPAN